MPRGSLLQLERTSPEDYREGVVLLTAQESL